MRVAPADPDLAGDAFGLTSVAQPTDGKAAWASEEGRGPLRVTEWERGRLTVTDLGLSREHLLEGARLFRVGPRSDLLLAHDGTTVFVAGLLRAGDRTAPSLGLYRCDSPVASTVPGWQSVPLPRDLDELCCLRGAPGAVRLTGRRAGRPVVVEVATVD